MFDRLLGVHKAGLKDISTLCVITGPGRFTGLRVGLTLAGALKTLAGITVYSSTLFEVLAAQAAASKEFRAWASGRKEPRLAALVHAFKNEYFCQLFGPSGRGLKPWKFSLAPGRRAGATWEPLADIRDSRCGGETGHLFAGAGRERAPAVQRYRGVHHKDRPRARTATCARCI